MRENPWPPILADLLLNDDAHVGCCGLRPYDLQRRVYELGFHLKKQFWGQGLATEAGRAVLDWAAKNLRPASLFAGHHPENRASEAVLKKLSFVYTHDEPYAATGYFILPTVYCCARSVECWQIAN